MTSRAIFLDRDGVINRAIVREGKPYPPASLEELEILEGVRPALARLKQSGFLLFVVTNQPDVARGSQTKEAVERIHEFLAAELPLDGIFACYHDESFPCACRKPSPGLLLQAADRYDVDLPASYMIGDRWKDIAAGQAAGCTTIFIDYHYAEKQPDPPFKTAYSLFDSLRYILG
jgi:D-glycero-D-manno-heptose 1,7-bisphosphate phosphatase